MPLDRGAPAGAPSPASPDAPGAGDGLSPAEAAARLQRDGPNQIPELPPTPLWRQFGRQLVHFFAGMLWVAAILAAAGGMPVLALAIVGVIVFNALFSFGQEYRAERATARLRQLVPRWTLVVRGGRLQEVEAAELVRGDRVQLRPGDRVAADLRLVEVRGLALDQSLLTGESLPVEVALGATAFAGTFAVRGEAAGDVVATGQHTRLAAIARLTRRTARPPTPLALELDRVVRVIALAALGVGGAFLVASVGLGLPLQAGFLFAIGVTVALVPEGLLPEVTLALALGAEHMARRQALVRRLESVETLGSTTFICTDKTGTLTCNEANVVEAWTPSGSARRGEANWTNQELPVTTLRGLAEGLRRCGRVVERRECAAPGDPIEMALEGFAQELLGAGAPPLPPETQRTPFDPQRRLMSVASGGWLWVKGAPEAVAARARGAGGMLPAAERMGARGLRVVALARRRLEPPDLASEAPAPECDLEVVGMFGLEDRPRPEAAAAIAACRRAGIRLAMVTGDHPVTARAIAREVGLLGSEERVLTAAELPADEAELGAAIDHDGIVLSRVTPEDKLRIARALRHRGHVVAMTGDGANDAPALREAAIGIAMGRTGTDVAREAADLVLLDDNFATIVAAVAQGRATFSNIRRFLTYALIVNVAELAPFLFWALSRGRIPLALGVLQILAVDLGTGILPALALGAEPQRGNELDYPPGRRHLIDRGIVVRAFGVLGPVEALMEMLAFAAGVWAAGGLAAATASGEMRAASGAAFLAVITGQLGSAIACRSSRTPPWRLVATLGRNPLLLGAMGVELLTGIGLLTVPVLAGVLGQRFPYGAGLGVGLSAVAVMLAADAAYKRGRIRQPRG